MPACPHDRILPDLLSDLAEANPADAPPDQIVRRPSTSSTPTSLAGDRDEPAPLGRGRSRS